MDAEIKPAGSAQIAAPARMDHLRRWLRDTPVHRRDLSATGAKVTTEEAIVLPASFRLAFARRQNGANCAVVWRRGQTVASSSSASIDNSER